MKLPIALSIIVSVVIIGGAVWIRVVPSADERANLELIATQQKEADEAYYQEFLNTLEENSSASSTDTGIPPTGAGIIGPQLIKDYVALNNQGLASRENVSLLVEKYIDYIPSLVSVNIIQSSDIKSVPNTYANFEYYNSLMEPIEIERRRIVTNTRSNISKIDGTNSEALKILDTTASAYENAVNKAKVVPVPQALVTAHVRLLNNFLTTATHLKTIQSVNEDPTLAFSGMINVNNSLSEEESIVHEIVEILVKNGLQ